MPQIIPSRLSGGTLSRCWGGLSAPQARLEGSWGGTGRCPVRASGNEPQAAIAGSAGRDAGGRLKVNEAMRAGACMRSLALTVDARAVEQRLDCNWERVVAGRATEGLRARWQDHLRMVATSGNFASVRFQAGRKRQVCVVSTVVRNAILLGFHSALSKEQ